MVNTHREFDSRPPPLKRWATLLYVVSTTVVVGTGACDRSSNTTAPPVRASESNSGDSTTLEKLPHRMKGWELYCWEEDDQVHFTLIIGTNANKMSELIFTPDLTAQEQCSPQSGESYELVKVVGLDAARRAIARLPRGEYLTIHAVKRSSEPNLEYTEIPKEVLDMVKDVAAECGIQVPQID